MQILESSNKSKGVFFYYYLRAWILVPVCHPSGSMQELRTVSEYHRSGKKQMVLQ